MYIALSFDFLAVSYESLYGCQNHATDRPKEKMPRERSIFTPKFPEAKSISLDNGVESEKREKLSNGASNCFVRGLLVVPAIDIPSSLSFSDWRQIN